MNIVGIIPARYGSTRFPAKALAEIEGVSIVNRVYNQAVKSKSLNSVVVATDHVDIFNHVRSFGGNVVLTHENHPSGTDRVFEAASSLDKIPDVVVNIQGDEPFISPNLIDDLTSAFNNTSTSIATVAKKISNSDDLFNPNIVKLVVNKEANALYFSRNPIPFIRQFEPEFWLQHHDFYKHIGLYAYRFEVLQQIIQLPISSLEAAESLEQLRWLENGFQINVQFTDYESIGIDTPEDLMAAIRFVKSNSPIL